MGLGLLGRGVGDVAFLAECGADLIVTDLKTKTELKESLNKLKKFKNIKYVLGEHRLEDFRDRDFILKAAGVPLDSIYIAEAKKNNIPVEMSASLFAKLVKIPIIGITGTRGKSTVTHLLHHILKEDKKDVLLGGNVKGVSTLSLLKKVKKDSIALFELDSWQLQGFGDSRMSPQISIFTTFLDDHLAYYKNDRNQYFEDKANIFKYQNKNDMLIVGKQASPFVEKISGKISVKPIVAPEKINGFNSKLIGAHNDYNIALAVTAARILGVKDSIIKKAVKSFKGIEGRLELIKEIKGVKYYNDTTATTPDATVAALKALGKKSKNIILIAGGSDKNLDMSNFINTTKDFCKKVILLSGSGTAKIKSLIEAEEFDNLRKAVDSARHLERRGDVVLLSPAFASFGMFKNEYDRGEQFNKIVKKLK